MAVPRRRGRVDEVKDTVLKIQKNLQCPICLELLSDPYTTRCSHAFCRVCICTVISTSKRARCPLCKQAITKRSLNESARLGEIIEAVKALEVAIKNDTKEELVATPAAPAPSSHEIVVTPVLHKVPYSPDVKYTTSLEQSSVLASNTKGCGLIPEPLLDSMPCKRVRVASRRSETVSRRTSGRTGNKRSTIECPGDQRSTIECPGDQRSSIECPGDQRGSIERPGDQRDRVKAADATLSPVFQECDVTASDERSSVHIQHASPFVSNSPRVSGPSGTLPHVTIVQETPFAVAGGLMCNNGVVRIVNTNTHSEEPIWVESSPSSSLSPPHSTSGGIAEEIIAISRDSSDKVQPGDQVLLCDKVQSGDQVFLPDTTQGQLLLQAAPVSPHGSSILPPANESSPIIPLQNLPLVRTTYPAAVRQLNFELDPAMGSTSHEPSTVLSSQPSPSNRSILTHLPGLFVAATRCKEDPLNMREDAVESHVLCCPMPNENAIETVHQKEIYHHLEPISVDINHREPASVDANHGEPASVDMNHREPASVASVDTNQRELASVDMNHREPASVASVDMNHREPASVASVDMNHREPASVDTNHREPASVDTNHREPASVDTNQIEPTFMGPHHQETETPVMCDKVDVHRGDVILASLVAPSPPSSCDFSCTTHDETHPAGLTVVPDSFLQRESAPQLASFVNGDATTQPTQTSDPTSDEMTSQDVLILRKKMEEKQKEIEELEALLTHTAKGEHVPFPDNGCVLHSVAGDTSTTGTYHTPSSRTDHTSSSRTDHTSTTGTYHTPSSRTDHTPSSRTDQAGTSRPLHTPSKRGTFINQSLVAKAEHLLKALRQPIDQPLGEGKETLSNLSPETTCSKSLNSFLLPSCHLPVGTPAVCIGHTPRLHSQAHETNRTPFVCQKNLTPSSVENKNETPLQTKCLSEVSPDIGAKVVLDADDIETESPPEEIPLLPKDHPFLTVSTSNRPLPQSLTPFSFNTSVLVTKDSSKVSGGAVSDTLSLDGQKPPPFKRSCILSPGQIDTTPIAPVALNKRTPLAVKRESNMSGAPKCKNVKMADSQPLSLIGSGLTRAQLQHARIFAKKQGGRIADCCNGSTTHIVVNADENRRCSRTLKYLQGIASGRWIVDHKWIKDSLENEQQIALPETMYEVRGDHLYCVDAPQKARLSLARGEDGLFARLDFFVMEGCTPLPKDQITKLIQLAGGKIVSNPQSCLVICDMTPPSKGLSNSTTILSSWVTDSLSHYKLLSVREYLAKKV